MSLSRYAFWFFQEKEETQATNEVNVMHTDTFCVYPVEAIIAMTALTATPYKKSRTRSHSFQQAMLALAYAQTEPSTHSTLELFNTSFDSF